MDPRVFFICPYVISAAAIMSIGFYTLLRRDSTGAMYLALMCFSAGWWALTEGLLYLGAPADTNIWITKFQYLAITPTEPLAFLFILEVFGFSRYNTKWMKIFLFLLGLTTLVLTFGYPHIKIHWADHFVVTHKLFPMLAWRYGPFFWVFVIYNQLLLFLSSVILIRALGAADPIFRKRARVFLAVFVPVWILHLFYITDIYPFYNVDVSPLGFSLAAGIMAYGYYRYNMLHLFPAANKAALRHMNDALLVLDPKDRLVEINPAAESLLNVRESWGAGRYVGEILSLWPELKHRLDKDRGGLIDFEGSSIRRTFDLRLSPLKDRNGRYLGRLISLRDASTYTPLDSSSNFIVVIDRDWVVADANKAFLKFHENNSIIIGKHVREFPNIINDKDNLDLIDQALELNRSMNLEFEYKGRAYLNRIFPIEGKNGGRAGVLCMIKDVTDEKLREKRMLHVNKMSAVGRLASGVAHEIRSPMALIRNNCYILKKTLIKDPGSPGADSIIRIESAIDRAMGTIEHLLSFSRMSAEPGKECNVKTIIQRAAALCHETAARAGVEISINCQVQRVDGVDGDSLNIVTANLLSNALDAMPNGGLCRIEALVADQSLKILISDTGMGINEHELDLIFEPFYSTKKKDKGTGLGLYIVYNELQKYGGSIFVESAPGKGTSFTVVLPLTFSREAGREQADNGKKA